MIPNRYLATTLTFALTLGLVGPIASGGQIEVNFNDLSYAKAYDPNEEYPAGQAPGTGSYNDGWNLNGGFTSNGVFFSNTYYGGGGFTSWAYSDVDDLTTTAPGGPVYDDYTHQFAAITGTTPGGSGNYAIESGTGSAINLPAGASPVSFEVTNTTYTYLAITHGDGFSTAFTTGSYFTLEIYGWSGLNGTGTQVGKTIDFDLADYTSPTSLPVDVWTLVNLSTLTGAQSLTFDYLSSDTGDFGINTPETFAMDNLILSTSVPEPSSAVLALTGLTIAGLFVSQRRRRSIVAR